MSGDCFKTLRISEFETELVFEKAAEPSQMIFEEVLEGTKAYSEISPAFFGLSIGAELETEEDEFCSDCSSLKGCS